jgi:hypothetical protein
MIIINCNLCLLYIEHLISCISIRMNCSKVEQYITMDVLTWFAALGHIILVIVQKQEKISEYSDSFVYKCTVLD